MAELFELEQVLRSKPEKITIEEANVLMKCKAKGLRGLAIGAAAGGCITWLASQRLTNVLRINLSAGAAASLGVWMLGRSLQSCVQEILSLDGSRMQLELAYVMMQKYRDDPRIVQLVSKYFYPERLYDDSRSDTSELRWRYRNFFHDGIAHAVRANQIHYDTWENNEVKVETDNTTVKPKLDSQVSTGFSEPGNPFDIVFGRPDQGEAGHPDSSRTPRKHGRHNKRFQRRHHHGIHHQEVSPRNKHL